MDPKAKKEIVIEIGPNMKEAVLTPVKAVDDENERDTYSYHDPGEAIKKAFGIN